MSEPTEPIHLPCAQKDRAAEVLAKAFHDDPAYRCIFPDDDERWRSLRWLHGAIVGYGLEFGRVYSTPGVEGVACWLSPGNRQITVWRMLRTGLELQRAIARFRTEARQQLLAALAHIDALHKDEMTRPHWYLWALGVDPAFQGQGIGSTLIRPVLEQSDAEGIPCYLETLNEVNLPFYRKHGFTVLGEDMVPMLGLTVWSMLREPNRDRSSRWP